MSGKGKAGKSGGKAGGEGKSQSRSAKAGLQFPVGRIHRLLKRGNYAQRVGAGAPVYLAAVLEYLAAEILELAGNAARDNKKQRIVPRHLQLAIRNDEELNKLLGSVVISQGGVVPFINPELLPNKSSKGSKKDSQERVQLARSSTSTSDATLIVYIVVRLSTSIAIMNHYQQQYSARPQQPLQAPHAPISPYFAARQRFEQSAYPAQSQSQAIDQHPRPPQHPKQQQRAGTHQHTHPHSQTRAQVQQRLGPQLQAQSYNMPPSQYAQVQQPPYQPQYAQQSQRMQTQAPYAPQYSVQATSPSAPYGQRTYSYPPLHSQARVQPAPAPTLYQAQQPYTSSYNAQAARAYALLQAQQTPSYVRPAGPPQATATAVPGSSVYTPSPQNNPGAGGRRPLPTPSQARPRPLSMPPQPAQGAPSARIFGHSSSSSLSHIIPQPSMTQPSPLPISPLPAATSSASPKRRPLPSPSPTSGSAPLPPASPASVRPAGSPGSAHMTLGQIPSSEKSPSSSYVSITSSQASAPGSPQKTPTQRRALPQSPSVPPDLSQIHRGGGTLARNGTVIHLVSQFGGKGNQVNPSAERGNIKPQKPTSQTPTACSSYMPRSPVRASTLPATVQSAPLNPLTFHQAPASQVLYSDEEGAEESGGEGDMLSEVSEDSAHQSHGQMPSPQYGIRDLPKRNTFISGPPGREVASKPESSPQYGIKDLPTRAKSVIDRRRAWERAEQGMNNGPVGSSQMVSNSGSKTAFEPNKRIFEASTPAKPPDATLPPPVTHISPSRSPQPQTPQQEQKLPMPAVQHPQPSYTDRQPSWTLPTADLERIEKRTHSGEQKTSMAFKFATMSLAEENTVNANAADAPSHTQTNYRPLAQSSTSRSGSPKKPYPFGTRTPRTVSNTDLSLDDAPPPSLRRTPSPSLSAASSSAPSIPTSRTPDDVPDLSGQQHNGQGVSIPKIDLPDDFDYDNNIVNVPSVEVQVPSIVVSPKPMSPRRAGLPVIIFPDDEGVEVNGSGPAISVTSPAAPHAPMPVILDDLVSSPSKSRGLPRPPEQFLGICPD
ncbi:hypothetical protein EW145_g4469 [Phellinidium pouzarii]|uniref:Histone H2A n=1 Tax=Phellinidium pouzarii TaxID=167371 RepID=A0A4S4L3K9_9AGAM|nr:hypothetical protein EW145_g4469 [Phellinidium pouzarii]